MMGRSNRRVLLAAGFIAVFLPALLARDRIDPNVIAIDVPNLPPDDKLVIATNSFGGVWKAALSHVDANYDSLNLTTDDALTRLSEFSRRGCMKAGEATDLARLGLDPSREAALAFYFPLSNPSKNFDVLAVLPVADRQAFEESARRLVTHHRLQSLLTAADGSLSATKIRIDEVSVSAGSFACWDDGSPIQAGQIVTAAEWPNGLLGAKLNVKLDREQHSTFHVKCTAFDAADRPIPCGCRDATDDAIAETSSPEACDLAVEPSGSDEPQTLEAEGRSYPVLRPFDFWTTVPDTDYALVATSQGLLEWALAVPPRQLKLVRPRAFSQSNTPIGDGGGELVGEALMPGPSLASKIPIGVQLSLDEIHLAADLKLLAGDASVLRSLLKDEPVPAAPVVRGTIAAFSLDGKQGSKLLRYANRWIPEFRDMLRTGLGDLSLAMQRLSEADSLENVRVILLGMRDGIPELAIMARIPEADAQALIADLQWEMKVKRDADLINAAVAKSGEGEIPIGDLVTRGFLKPEDGTNWADYSIAEGQAVPPEQRSDLAATALYRGTIGEQPVDFLMPPFTDNDYALRVEGAENADKIDKEGLFNGRYRLAATYVEKDGLLWIGNDIGTLKLLLENREPVSASIDDVTAADGAGTRKMSFVALPDLLLGLGQEHPDEAISSSARNLYQLQRYRLLSGSIGAREDRQEIEINVDVTR
jgi:hypothetical protein